MTFGLPGVPARFLRRGSRTVLQTYAGLRIGNYLYFALHAFLESRGGRDYRVLDSGLDSDWLTLLPGLSRFLVQRPRIFDRTEHIPQLFYQQYGTDFGSGDLAAFVRSTMGALPRVAADFETVTVNVRRGDYYSSAGRINEFGFDVAQYVSLALAHAESQRPIAALKVVSDDSAWTSHMLSVIRPDLVVAEVVNGRPVHHFAALANSPRLVLANSTFSYWGAYVSEVFNGAEGVEIYAPDLHSRLVLNGQPWQHAPSWTELPTVPVADD
jgi:hypothetical protein